MMSIPLFFLSSEIAMRRGTDSRVSGPDSKRGRVIGSSISDLPSDILEKILLRLPVKSIAACKCVCKSWYDLISHPEFAKLHFDQGDVYPLLYFLNRTQDSELNLGICDPTHSISYIDVNLEKAAVPGKNCYILDSCNGLLLLCIPNDKDNQHYIVCNPITGEFINLPEAEKLSSLKEFAVHCGFGFSATSNQYKVIRMSRHLCSISHDMRVEVHILGTESWKDMGWLPLPIESYSKHTYVNGFVYWWPRVYKSRPIVSFDVEKECFQSIFVKGMDRPGKIVNVSMKGIGQELYVTGFRISGKFHVWVMKDECAEKALSLVFSIEMPSYGRQIFGPLEPIKYLNDGLLLVFDFLAKALIYIDSRKREVRYFKVYAKDWKVDMLAHIPSFVSLEYALSGQNVGGVKVLNARLSSESQFKRETVNVDIVEQELNQH